MEESLSLLGKIKTAFLVNGVDVRAYSPLPLAYIGDAIYELVIRTVVVERSNQATNALHKKTTGFVKAETQAAMMEVLLPLLTEEEEAVYKRGRNAKSASPAKNASLSDYRKATGFEAVIGYLYLQDNMDRILVLVKEGLAGIHKEL